MKIATIFLCFCLVSCEKPALMGKKTPPNEPYSQLTAQDSNLIIKRLEAKTLEAYLEIGSNLDTVAASYSELPYDSIVAINHLYIGMRLARDTSKVDTILKRPTLTPQKAQEIVQILQAKENYDSTSFAKCFEPHITFIFYRKNEIVGSSSVCLQCSMVSSSLKHSSIYSFSGMSNVGRKSFRNVCTELNFSYCK